MKNSSKRAKEETRPEISNNSDIQLAAEILNQLDNGLVITDTKGSVLEWNQTLERMTGIKQEQARGKPLWDVLSQASGAEGLPRHEYAALKSGLLEMLVTGNSTFPAETSASGQIPFPGKAASLKPAWKLEVHPSSGSTQELEFHFKVFKSGDQWILTGVVQGFERFEEQAQQAGLHARVVESAAHGIAITNPQGEILWVNPAFTRMTGYSPGEAIGNTLRMLKSGRQDRFLYEQLWNTVLSGRVWHGELVNRRKDGSLYEEEQTITPVVNSQGQVTHFIAIMEDITRYKQSEKDARTQRALAEALRSTAYTLVHELNFELALDHILENMRKIFEFDAANIMLLNPDGSLQMVRRQGYEEHGQEEALADFHLPAADMFSISQVMASGEPAIIPDTSREPGWHPYPPLNWIRSHVSAPIHRGERVIGFINVDSATPGFFKAQAASQLQDFADQAGVVLENARLYDETHRRAHELEVLFEISNSLRQVLTRQETAEIVLDHLQELFEASKASMTVFDHETGEEVLSVQRGEWLETGGPRKWPKRAPDGRPHLIETSSERGREAIVGVKLMSQGQSLGVVWLGCSSPITDEKQNLLSAIANTTAGVLHRAALFEQTQARLNKLSALRVTDQAITSTRNLDIVLKVLLQQVKEQLGPRAAAVLLFNTHTGTLNFRAGYGFNTHGFHHAVVQIGEGAAGAALVHKQAVSIPDLLQPDIVFTRLDEAQAEGFRAYHAMPLVVKDQVKGVLETYHDRPFSPSSEWLDFFRALASQAAVAVDNASLYAHLRRTNRQLMEAYSATLGGWSKALELRDQETEGHTRRVSDLTLQMAEKVGYTDDELLHVYHGALLHDIGKMAIPDSILLKPGPLTAEEWKVMRKHPVYAYELLSPIPFLRPALAIPRYHHERWDGTGYPYSLSGEQIPLAARLFAIIDVWDALISDRPYRKAWPVDKVHKYLKAQSGKHFDPEVVQIFFSALTHRVYSYPDPSN